MFQGATAKCLEMRRKQCRSRQSFQNTSTRPKWIRRGQRGPATCSRARQDWAAGKTWSIEPPPISRFVRHRGSRQGAKTDGRRGHSAFASEFAVRARKSPQPYEVCSAAREIATREELKNPRANLRTDDRAVTKVVVDCTELLTRRSLRRPRFRTSREGDKLRSTRYSKPPFCRFRQSWCISAPIEFFDRPRIAD